MGRVASVEITFGNVYQSTSIETTLVQINSVYFFSSKFVSEIVLQTIILALNRSDYMIGTEDDEGNEATARGNLDSQSNTNDPASNVKLSLKQIEFNTVAASFAGLAQNLYTYHR